LKPWLNGSDVVGRQSGRWIVDFGSDMGLREAQLYEAPFEYLRSAVHSTRQGKRETRASVQWWIMQRARAVQRYLLKAQRTEELEAAECGGVTILGDCVGLIEPQNIVSKAAQSCKDSRVFSDA